MSSDSKLNKDRKDVKPATKTVVMGGTIVTINYWVKK